VSTHRGVKMDGRWWLVAGTIGAGLRKIKSPAMIRDRREAASHFSALPPPLTGVQEGSLPVAG